MGLVRVRLLGATERLRYMVISPPETGTNRSWSWPEVTTTRTGSRQLETGSFDHSPKNAGVCYRRDDAPATSEV